MPCIRRESTFEPSSSKIITHKQGLNSPNFIWGFHMREHYWTFTWRWSCSKTSYNGSKIEKWGLLSGGGVRMSLRCPYRYFYFVNKSELFVLCLISDHFTVTLLSRFLEWLRKINAITNWYWVIKRCNTWFINNILECSFTFPSKPQITSQSENSNLILNTKETCRVSM